MIPNIQFAVGNDWVCPCLLHIVRVLRLAWGCETALLVVGFWRGFDQGDIAILTVQIKVILRVAERGRSQRALLPFYLARRELDANQRLRGCAIEVVSD